MEQMDLIKMTPDAKKAAQAAAAAAASKNKNNKNTDYNDKENNSSLNKSGLLDDEVIVPKKTEMFSNPIGCTLKLSPKLAQKLSAKPQTCLKIPEVVHKIVPEIFSELVNKINLEVDFALNCRQHKDKTTGHILYR